MLNEDTVEIYTLWDRLKKRFSIVKPQPKSFILKDTVQPITSVDFALVVAAEKVATIPITGNGQKFIFTVPDGKRWLVSLTYLAQILGTFDLTQFFVRGDSYNTPYHEGVSLTGVPFYHPHPLLLTEGNKLGVTVANYVAAGDVYSAYWVKETNLEE